MTASDKNVGHTAPTFRRHVFYIPGFDPYGPRRYREIYRREGKMQSEISGYDLTLAAVRGNGSFGWEVHAKIGGAHTRAQIEVLVWADIVRASMGAGVIATYGQMLRIAWVYVGSGALWRLVRLRKGPAIAALYPIVVLILQAVGAALIGVGAGAAATLAGHWAIGFVVGTIAAASVLEVFRRLDRHIYAYYLMHDYAFSAGGRGAIPVTLAARLTEFGDKVAAALASDVDEVLVVGHSSGAQLAIQTLAGLVRGGRVPEDGPALGLLTLGQVVPMVSFLPEAGELRRDLRDLSVSAALTWVDVTAPGDGCAFALCDPVAVSGVATPDKRWPLVISAAFTQSLSPERWNVLRWKFFRLHFQYLCAFDRPGNYDYFQITAGPKTLAERFSGRVASKSRIERPASGYRNIA